MNLTFTFRILTLLSMLFAGPAFGEMNPTIPPTVLTQLLDAPHEQLALIAREFNLKTKSDEFISENEKTIETCYRKTLDSELALCKMSILQIKDNQGIRSKMRPMAFLLIHGEDANTRAYERIVEGNQCIDRNKEQILSGTSTECITKDLKITFQKRMLNGDAVNYQIYVERR